MSDYKFIVDPRDTSRHIRVREKSRNRSPPLRSRDVEIPKALVVYRDKQRSSSSSREHDREKSQRSRSQSVPDVQLQPSKTRHHHHHRKDESKDKDRSRKVLYVATAIYAFSGTSSGDLSLHAGDVLEITKEVNADWLKGKNVITHQSGTFPRRYVKEKTQEKSIYKPEKAIRPVPPPEAPRTIAPVSAPTYYEQPQAMVPVQPSYRPPMMPAPVPAQVYQPNPAQAYQPMPTQAFQPPPRRGLAKNIAGNLGNAFVFGAGATAGADLVNSIF